MNSVSSEPDQPVRYFRATTRAARPQAPVQAGRRKWSDWAECSSECVQTRHRLHCDDLVQLQRPHQIHQVNKTQPVKRKSISGRNKQQDILQHDAITSNERRPLAELESSETVTTSGVELKSSPLGADEEQEDYADEGDDEDGNDSCARVESSKTFQERTCSGGQCKFAPIQPAGQPHDRRHYQPRPSGVPSHANGFQPPPVDSPARPKQTKSNHQDGLPTSRQPAPTGNDKAHSVGHQLGVEIKLAEPRSVAGLAGAPSHHWSVQSQESIQLALLSGALVALILFTLLVIRKLIQRRRRAAGGPLAKLRPSSSYHWMLARHTKRQQPVCCPHAAARSSKRHIRSIESNSSSETATTASTTLLAAQAGKTLGSHFWPIRPEMSASSANKQQFFIDVNGQHHRLASSGADNSLGVQKQPGEPLLRSPPSHYYYQLASGEQHQPASLSRSAAANCDKRPLASDEHEYDDAIIIGHSSRSYNETLDGRFKQRQHGQQSIERLAKDSSRPLAQFEVPDGHQDGRPEADTWQSSSSSSISVQSTTAQLVSAAQSQSNETNLSSFENQQELRAEDELGQLDTPQAFNTPVRISNGVLSSLASSSDPIQSGQLVSPAQSSIKSARVRATNQLLSKLSAGPQSQPNSPTAGGSSASGKRQQFRQLGSSRSGARGATRGHSRMPSSFNSHSMQLSGSGEVSTQQEAREAGHFYEEINR